MDDIEQIEQQPEAQEVEVNYEALKEGKVDFHKLPKEDRAKIAQEAFESLPDDDAKEAWQVYGWRPKELFLGKNKDGSPKEWVDYKEFREKIDTIAPVKNERIRSLAKEKDEYKEKLEAMERQMKILTEINKSKLEREIFGEEKNIEKEISEAREYSDVARYEQAIEKKNLIERDKLRLKTFEEPPVAPMPLIPPVQQLPEEVTNWAANNTWIVSDAKLLEYAKIKEAEMSFLHPDKSLTERLEMVREEVGKAFPDKDPTPKRPAVESAKNVTAFGNIKPKGKSFDDIPELDRRQADILIRKGVYKDKNEYMRLVWN